MLPTPASYSRRQNGRDFRSVINKAFLFSRSRVTNLAVFLLCASLSISLLTNFSYFLSHVPETPPQSSVASSILQTITRSKSTSSLKNLIIVAGHAVWTGCNTENLLDEKDWVLEARQKGGGNVDAFVKHIMQGAEAMLSDPHSLLVFSGGQTRPGSLTTEAQSYHRLAEMAGFFNILRGSRHVSSFKPVVDENFALDSFQNLIFSIARFREVTGSYPEHITVIGFGMKRQRFEQLHRTAIRWPKSRFEYIGIDVKGDTTAAYKGEAEFGYTPYSRDLYGCHGDLLEKRRRRNPYSIFHPYHTSAPEMSALFDWCPSRNPSLLFPGRLPWDDL